MAAFASGEKTAENTVRNAIAAVYLKKGFTVEALKLKAPELAPARHLGSTGGAIAADALVKVPAAGDVKSAKEAVSAARDSGDKSAEASALAVLSSAYVATGDAQGAGQAATQGLALIRAAGNKGAELPALQALVTASLASRDFDGAVSGAKEVVRSARAAGNKKAEAAAHAHIAAACVAGDDLSSGLTAAEAALALYKDLGDKQGQLSVWATVCDANVLNGRPAAAAKAAKEAVGLAKGDTTAEAAASLMMGDANVTSKDSLDAAQAAVKLFKDLGDKAGEGSALPSVANCALSQQQPSQDEALQAAKDAAAIFKESESHRGEALALSFVAFAYIMKEDGQEAEAAARGSLNLFRDVLDAAGENYAMALLNNTKTVGAQQSTARLLIDNSNVAHVELNELASQQSLEAVIDALLTTSAEVGCIVLHIEGTPGPVALQSYAVTSGGFLMGLRTIGKPVICACWGKIAGPTWAFVLCSDYRFAATSTTFMCPMWGPPEVMGDLVGFQIATKLFQANGPESAFSMLEAGICHQLQKGKEDTRKCASEMAKRIAACPTTAQKQTMHLMGAAVEKFALACAKGGVRA